MTTLVLLSDTHTLHERIAVPDGDVLVHAGDFCGRGSELEAMQFAGWFMNQPHKHKIVIAGNHDIALEKDPRLGHQLFGDSYLFDSSAKVAGLKFYGSPWQPEFFDWAFNLPRGERLRQRWDAIPDDTDVLVTHGPPAWSMVITRGAKICASPSNV